MRGTIKASKSVIYETLDRYKDWKYSDAVPENNEKPNEYLCSMMKHFIKKLMY